MMRVATLFVLVFLSAYTRADGTSESETLSQIEDNDRKFGLVDCRVDKDCPENFPYCRTNQFALSLGIKEGPFLEKIGKRCYQCRKDSQCEDPTAFCVEGLCRNCRRDSDCPSETSVCLQNDCVQCDGSKSFSSQNTCGELAAACAREGLFANQCVQCAGVLDGCDASFSTACSSVFTPFVSNSSLPTQQPFCVQCLDSSDCLGTNRVCDPADLQCKGCLSSDDCSDSHLPVCDVDRNVCVQCLNSTTDCSGNSPVCLNTTASCVQCSQDLDCPDNELPGFIGCVGNTCQYNCTNDANCTASNPFCDLTQDLCVECRNNTDCGDGQNKACLNGECVMCATNEDCYTLYPATPGSNLFCSNSSNTCVACRNNDDCVSPTGVCDLTDPLKPVCRQCLADSDCPSQTPKCDLSSNTCTACLSSSDCTGSVNTKCLLATAPPQKNTCVQCLDDTTCSGSTPKCQTSSHKCVQCLTNDQCQAPNGVCRPDNTCGPECTASDQCTVPPKTVCNLQTDTCVECTNSNQCVGASNFCNTASGTCTQCASDQIWDQARQVCVSCTPIAGCTSISCPSGTSTCSQCDTSLNYQANPVGGQCVCETGYRDLNGDPADGCEYKQTCDPNASPVNFPVFYQDCNYGTSTWQPFCLTEGTFDVSTRAADMSSMRIGPGFRVSFKYKDGTVSDPNRISTCDAWYGGETTDISCFVTAICLRNGGQQGVNMNDKVVQVTVTRVP